MEVQVNV